MLDVNCASKPVRCTQNSTTELQPDSAKACVWYANIHREKGNPNLCMVRTHPPRKTFSFATLAVLAVLDVELANSMGTRKTSNRHTYLLANSMGTRKTFNRHTYLWCMTMNITCSTIYQIGIPIGIVVGFPPPEPLLLTH